MDRFRSNLLSKILLLVMIFQVLAPVKISAMGQGTNLEAVESEEPEFDEDQGILDSSEGSEDTEPGSEGTQNLDELDGADQEGSQVEDEPGEETQSGDSQADAGGEKSFHLSLEEAKGPNGEEISEANPLDLEDEFRVYYSWKLDNGHGYKAGDKVSFKLPKGLKILEEAEGELRNQLDEIFARYKVSMDGNVSFTFTDAVEKLSNISGDFLILSKIDREEVEVDDKKIVIEPIGDGKSLTIPVNTDSLGLKLEKTGEANKLYSPDRITWIIEVDSGIVKEKNAKITDKLPEGLTYVEGSLKIDGKVQEVSVTSDQTISLNLGDFKGKKIITFETIINEETKDQSSLENTDNEETKDQSSLENTDNEETKGQSSFKNTDNEKSKDKSSFENTASYSSNSTASAEASGTVTINRGQPLTKKGISYDPISQELEWEVELNFNAKNLGKTTLKDTWQKGLMELTGPIKIYEAHIDENEKVTLENPTEIKAEEASDSGFQLTIKDIDKPHVVKYKTKLKERLEDSGEIVNNVDWNGKESTGSIGAEQGIGYKSYSDINYKDKTVKWVLVANTDQKTMKKFTIKDQLGPGLKLQEDSFSVRLGGKEISKDSDYTLEVSEDSFTLSFNKDVEEEVGIEYKTSFDYSKLKAKNKNFINNAEYKWSDGSVDKIKELNSGFTPNDYTQNNSFKSGSYNAVDKTISWTVGLNYQQNQYDNLKLIDELQGDQKLKDNSLKIFEALISEEGQVEKGAEIKDIKSDIDEKELELFFGSTNAPYIVEYQTSLKDLDYIEESYSNKAEIMDGKDRVTELEAVVHIPHGSYYGLKEGVQNGKMIDWTVSLNPSQSKISNLSLKDKLSGKQELLKDSIKVYATEVAEDGSLTKGKEYKKIELDTSHENGFSLNFKDTISEPYIVEYSSIYFAYNEALSNGYEVSGKDISASDKSEGNYSLSIRQTSGGAVSGKVGRLRIKKVDADNNDIALEGAEFQLLDADSNSEIKKVTTNPDGTIDFGRLLFGKYKLVETKAPEGYKRLTEPIDIEINEEYEEGREDKVGNFLEVGNELDLKKIKINKSKLDGGPLEGAEFEISKQDGTVILDKLTTDKDGQAISKGLPFGRYKLEETKAPEGYQSLPSHIILDISESSSDEIVIDIKNAPLGHAQILKREKITELPIAGVEFKLEKKDADGSWKELELVTTNEIGLAFSERLDIGDYRYIEISGPEGLIIDEEPIEFTVNESHYTTKELSFIKENSYKKPTLELLKLDKTSRKLLKNAEFDLYKLEKTEESSLVKSGLKTDGDGLISIEVEEEGEYYFIETKAPKGYLLDKTHQKIEAKKGLVEKIEVTNEKKAETPTPTNPGENKPTTPTDPEENKPTKPTEPGEKEPETPTNPGEKDTENPGGNEPTAPGEKPETPTPTDPGEEDKPTNPEKPGEKDTEVPGENKPTTPTEPGEKEPVRPGENKPVVPEEEKEAERPGEKPKDPTDPVIPEEDPSIKDGEVAEKPGEDIVVGESAGKEEDKSDINGDNKEGYESGNIGLDNSANSLDEENSEIKGDKEEASDKEGSQAKLPATGESSKYISLLAGFLILALGLSLWNKKEIKN